MLRISRFIKRGPGAILGLALLLVIGVGVCSWYREHVVWGRITPEQAARAYVQMIVNGDFETWDELNPPEPGWCYNARCSMTLTEVSAQREQAPQLIDLSVRPTYSTKMYVADMRLDVGGEERSYSMTLTRGETGSDLTGWWKVKQAPEDMTAVSADQAILSVTHIDGRAYTQPEESKTREWPMNWQLATTTSFPGVYDLSWTKMSDHGRAMVLREDTGQWQEADDGHVTITSSGRYRIAVVPTAQDFEEVRALAEQETRECLSGQWSDICNAKVNGAGDDGITIEVSLDQERNPETSIFGVRMGGVTVTLPSGSQENERFGWRYVLDDQGQTRVEFSYRKVARRGRGPRSPRAAPRPPLSRGGVQAWARRCSCAGRAGR